MLVLCRSWFFLTRSIDIMGTTPTWLARGNRSGPGFRSDYVKSPSTWLNRCARRCNHRAEPGRTSKERSRTCFRREKSSAERHARGQTRPQGTGIASQGLCGKQRTYNPRQRISSQQPFMVASGTAIRIRIGGARTNSPVYMKTATSVTVSQSSAAGQFARLNRGARSCNIVANSALPNRMRGIIRRQSSQ